MTSSVLTLIAAERLDDNMLCDLRQSLEAEGARLQEPVWLAPARALDLGFSGLDPARAQALACQCRGARPVDLVAQAVSGRRKKLLIADMDSTIVIGETLDDLADHAGVKQRVAAITERSMRGEIDFKAALRERVGLLAGLSERALAATEQNIMLTPGARTLVGTMRAAGATTILVSGGFDYFTSRVRARCGFDDDRANHLEISAGRLTGHVREPILDRDAKLGYLRQFAADCGVRPDETLAVGDGANDLAMIREAGLGVAFHAKPVVAAEAAFRVDHTDLTALLFAQGYRQDEFID